VRGLRRRQYYIILTVFAILVIGVYIISHKSSSLVLSEKEKEEDTSHITNNQFVEKYFAGLNKSEMNLLLGKESDLNLSEELYSKFKSERNEAGMGLAMAAKAAIVKSDSLYVVAGEHIFNSLDSISEENEAKYLFSKAREVFQKALEINPSNLSANNNLALVYIDMDQDVMKGVSTLKKTLELDSNNIDAIRYLGYLSIKSQQYDLAIKRFKKLISLQPSNPDSYFQLSEIYMRMGDTEKGKQYLEVGKNLRENQRN
jgi:tetratricopeptide (TPR) repeat protein